MSHVLSTRSLEFAQTLVRMNTVSARSNLELIEFARDHLAGLGVRSRLTYNADKSKANLFATLGAGKKAGIIVSGHTDTVPWDGQDWSVDPLSATVQDWPQEDSNGEVANAEPRLYGRGSADMKSFIAIALANAEHFIESESPFAVHFAFSYDEEVGCFGVRELIADMKDQGIKPAACIIGEPTLMVPAIAHKGVYRYRCCARGKEAHSSLTPQSVNAIEMAARVVGKVRDMAEGFERDEARYAGFDVPFSTASVGQFHGGIADNVVPRDAEFRYEFRNLPTADALQMQKEVVAFAGRTEGAMKKIAPDAGFSFETICEVPSFLSSANEPVTRLAQRLAHEQRTTLVAFGTEAGIFKGAGIPTVVCGPGSIEQAHQPDEYVTLPAARTLRRVFGGPGRDQGNSLKRIALGLLCGPRCCMRWPWCCRRVIRTGGFLGYVAAFAEAAMVGAIADWFAVVALFRHPLGLPIPHTAIIPAHKTASAPSWPASSATTS